MNLRQQFEDKHSFGVSLMLIFATLLVGSLPFSHAPGVVLRVVAGGAAILSVLIAARAGTRTRILAGALFVAGMVLSLVGVVATGSGDTWVSGVADIFLGLLTALMIGVIAANLITHLRVSLRTVAGALCVYLLIGILFATIYTALGALGQAPLSEDPLHYRDAIYFSYVTQLTLGYGDIVPKDSFARMLAVTEGLVGQIYIVTVLAVLVGNLGRERPKDRSGGGENQAGSDGPN